MKIRLITIGTNMPSWLREGFQEYAKRLPKQCALELIEIPLGKRTKNSDNKQAIQYEGEQMLKHISNDQITIALDEKGKLHDTKQLATQLQHWMTSGQDVNLLIGGPDGLAPACKEKAHNTWSLSPLTLPHMLVRVVVAEQIYRAFSLLNNHPYHRD